MAWRPGVGLSGRGRGLAAVTASGPFGFQTDNKKIPSSLDVSEWAGELSIIRRAPIRNVEARGGGV